MLGHQNGKIAVAALVALLAGSASGAFPVARFVLPANPAPPVQRIWSPDSTVEVLPLSTGSFRVGGVKVDALLDRSKVQADGTFFVDVRLTADQVQDDGVRRPIDFALVLDVSGSMADDNKIGLMKEACGRLEQRLGSEDRVALVSFSTSARTLFPLQSIPQNYTDCPLELANYHKAIQELVARGGTNISSGLELGAAELRGHARSGAARRIILLTDGQPNAGDATPEGLRGICSRLEREGISVSTVGLGLDYNAQLLSSMAESGGGSYHYVDAAERIAGIYDAELRSLRSLVARGVKVNVEALDGAEIVNVIEWQPERSGNTLGFNVGDMESGRATKIVLQLRATATPHLRVTATAADTKTGASATGEVALAATLTTNAEEARASMNADARRDLEEANVGALLETVREKVEKGDTAGARACLAQLRATRKEVAYKAADGKVASMNVDDLEKTLSADSYEERQRGVLFTKSAALATGK
jgi:Ca-activated chloride channel family protein